MQYVRTEVAFQKTACLCCRYDGMEYHDQYNYCDAPFFYLPPSNSGLVPLVPQLLVFGVLNIMSVIAASGRLFDAFYDPFIASLSDKSENPRGRRIPFMKRAIFPAVLFCCLTFYPVVKRESTDNAFWLVFTLIGFFVSATTYIIPYNALLPEMTQTAADKVKLSSFQQIGFVLGIIFSALVNNFADLIQRYLHIVNRTTSLQYTILGLKHICGFGDDDPCFYNRREEIF